MTKTKGLNPDLYKLVDPHDGQDGQWVVLARDGSRVLSHSKNRKTAMKQAKKTGTVDPLIVKSPLWKSLDTHLSQFIKCTWLKDAL